VASLMAMATDDLCVEIAIEQWGIILDRADALYHADEKSRNKKILKLAYSPLDDDRRVAKLVRDRLKAKD
jgi:hypothetical protein